MVSGSVQAYIRDGVNVLSVVLDKDTVQRADTMASLTTVSSTLPARA